MKNPFLNTNNYRIVQQFNKIQRSHRSKSQPQQPTALMSSGIHFHSAPNYRWATETRKWPQCQPVASATAHRFHQEYLTAQPTRNFEVTAYRRDSKYFGDQKNVNIFVDKSNQKNYGRYTPTLQQIRLSSSKHQQDYQLQFPQNNSSPPCPPPVQPRLQRVNTSHRIEYYQYSCQDSKQNSKQNSKERVEQDRIRQQSQLTKNGNQLRNSQRCVEQNSAVNIETNTNLSQSLCSLKMKTKANRFSSIAEFQTRKEMEEKAPEIVKSLRKRCSMFESMSKNKLDYMTDHEDEIETGLKQLSVGSKQSNKPRTPSKFSNFYNAPQQNTSEQSNEYLKVPPSIRVRGKAYHLCTNHRINQSKSYTKEYKKVIKQNKYRMQY